MTRRRLLISENDIPSQEPIKFSQMRSLSETQYCIGYNDAKGNEVDFPYTPERAVVKKEIYYPSDFNWAPVLVDEITSIKNTIKYLEIPPTVTALPCDFDASHTGKALRAVVFPPTFENIRNYAFQRTGLNDMSIIPASVNVIGNDRPFERCPLTEFRMDENNSVYSVQDGVIFNKAKTKILHYPCGSTRTSYQIPDTVTVIGLYTFSMVSNLKEVIIPLSVRSLERYVFNDTALDRIIVRATTVPTAESYTFAGFKAGQIVVPKGMLDAYKAAPYWSSQASKMVEEE